MRLSEPRLQPLSVETAEGESKAQLERAEARGGPVLNITRTLAHYPELSSAWGHFARHVLGGSSLPERERELIILRMGWNCQSGYEFGQHRRIGQQAGLSLEEVERVKQGPAHGSWTSHDAALLQAADELHATTPFSATRPGTNFAEQIRHQTDDGCRLRRRTIQPRLDGPQHPRRPARRGHARTRTRIDRQADRHARTARRPPHPRLHLGSRRALRLDDPHRPRRRRLQGRTRRDQ